METALKISHPAEVDPAAPVQIRLSEVLGALSYALDITEGQPVGHAARSCMLSMRLGRELRLADTQLSALFYASLLKDLGCSSNASRMCYLFGSDDRAAKRDIKSVDWTRLGPSIAFAARHVAPGAPLVQRAAKLTKLAASGAAQTRELIQMRCERGAQIALQLQLPPATANAIRAMDEHWNGAGHPRGLRGGEIPLLARILGLAQTAEVFIAQQGLTAALDTTLDRSGTWFDPELVRTFHTIRNDDTFWSGFYASGPHPKVAAFEPADRVLSADASLLDLIAKAFAQVIDAKSTWTCRHSEGVAEIAVGLAGTMGFSGADRRFLRRAALLHDLGKLSVSNTILDKPGRLTEEEIAAMRQSPRFTHEILTHVSGFKGLADLAASAGERLDGRGYHRGLAGDQLSTHARILATADMYEALVAQRPYRTDLSPEQVMGFLTQKVGRGICPEVFAALQKWLETTSYKPFRLAA